MKDGESEGPPPGETDAGGRPPGEPGPDARGPGGGFNPMQFDLDGDGKVSKEEAPQRMKMFFDRADSNGDGMLEPAEFEKMRSMRPPGAGRGPGGP